MGPWSVFMGWAERTDGCDRRTELSELYRALVATRWSGFVAGGLDSGRSQADSESATAAAMRLADSFVITASFP